MCEDKKQSQPHSLPEQLLVAWISFVLLASWFPFKIKTTSFDAIQSVVESSCTQRQSFSDFCVNVSVGIPVGFLASFCLILKIQNRAQKITCLKTLSFTTASILLASAVAIVAEIGQFFFVARDPSCKDAIAQSCGSGIASLIVNWKYNAFSLAFRSLRDDWISLSKFTRFLTPLAILYLILQFWPFIPSISPSEIKDKLNRIYQEMFSSDLLNTVPFFVRLFSFSSLLKTILASSFAYVTVSLIDFYSPLKHIVWMIGFTLSLTISIELSKIFIADGILSISSFCCSYFGMTTGTIMYLLSRKNISS